MSKLFEVYNMYGDLNDYNPIDNIILKFELLKEYLENNGNLNYDLVNDFVDDILQVLKNNKIPNRKYDDSVQDQINNIVDYLKENYNNEEKKFIYGIIDIKDVLSNYMLKKFTNLYNKKKIEEADEIFDKKSQEDKILIYMQKLDINRETTIDYINFITTHYKKILIEPLFVEKIEQKIIEHLTKEDINNINVATFTTFINIDINFSKDFKSNVICLIKKGHDYKYTTPKYYSLLNNIILGLKINYKELNISLNDYANLINENIGNIRNVILPYLDKSSLYKVISIIPRLLSINEITQTIELCLACVKLNGMVLEFVKNEYKTYEVCLSAVRSSKGIALKFVKDEYKTYEVCLAAVKLNGIALEFVKNELFDDLIIDAINSDLSFKFLISILEKKSTYKNVNNKNKEKIIDNYFVIYINYLLSKETNLNSLVSNNDKIIKLDNTKEYYHSYISQFNELNSTFYNSYDFIWFSDRFDQSFLHLFNTTRKLDNVKDYELIYLFIIKFKISKKINILKSQNKFNDNIFDTIIPKECLNKIMEILYIRHTTYINIYHTNIDMVKYINPLFGFEMNKFILIILKELNKFLNEDNKIYGYSNDLDQKEIALVGRNNLINPDSIKSSQYKRIIKKSGKEVNFPITYGNYKNEFNKEYITLYTTYLTILNEMPNINKNEMVKCMENKKIVTDSFRMFKIDNAKIFYEDFDDKSKEIEFKNLIFDDYWKKKYLKYKTKYLTIKKLLYNKKI
jgi:hypothetical protein